MYVKLLKRIFLVINCKLTTLLSHRGYVAARRRRNSKLREKQPSADTRSRQQFLLQIENTFRNGWEVITVTNLVKRSKGSQLCTQYTIDVFIKLTKKKFSIINKKDWRKSSKWHCNMCFTQRIHGLITNVCCKPELPMYHWIHYSPSIKGFSWHDRFIVQIRFTLTRPLTVALNICVGHHKPSTTKNHFGVEWRDPVRE